MFLGQIFAKNAKNDNKAVFEVSKSVKNKSRKITLKGPTHLSIRFELRWPS